MTRLLAATQVVGHQCLRLRCTPTGDYSTGSFRRVNLPPVDTRFGSRAGACYCICVLSLVVSLARFRTQHKAGLHKSPPRLRPPANKVSFSFPPSQSTNKQPTTTHKSCPAFSVMGEVSIFFSLPHVALKPQLAVGGTEYSRYESPKDKSTWLFQQGGPLSDTRPSFLSTPRKRHFFPLGVRHRGYLGKTEQILFFFFGRLLAR